jgi:co-chaperonin GroES (HSP10)
LNLSKHKALGDYVIVVPAVIKEAGITTRATQFEDRPDVGLLVSVGNEVSGLTEGDIVFFGKYSHVQVTHDDIIYLIMRAEDVYCVA